MHFNENICYVNSFYAILEKLYEYKTIYATLSGLKDFLYFISRNYFTAKKLTRKHKL